MIPDVKCAKFGEFYFTTIGQIKNELFLQLRDDGRTIQGNLRNFGWIEVTPISFSNIYINVIKNINNKQTYLFMLTSREEFMVLLHSLIENPNTPLPEALVYKEALPDVPSFRRKRDKKERKKDKKLKSELFQMEKELQKEEKQLEEEVVLYQTTPIIPEEIESKTKDIIEDDEDLF